MIAPLQLLDYTIDSVSYEQHRPDEADAEAIPGVGLSFDMEARFSDDEERNAELSLQVHFNEGDPPGDVEGHIYHRGRIKVIGWFSWADEEFFERTDHPRRLLLVNGMSTLYGVTRTYVAQLTEPGASPRLLLPMVNFLPLVKQWMDDQDEDGSGSVDDGANS